MGNEFNPTAPVTLLCRKIIKEAEAIIENTEDINSVHGDEAENLKAIRANELENLQILVTNLTMILNPEGGDSMK